MNSGKYLFSQLVEFLRKRIFDGIVKKYGGDRYVKTFTCWNQLLVMMFGQLSSCDSLRKVICIIDAIKNKSYHLGFGSGDIKLSNVAYANANRDYRIFEELQDIRGVRLLYDTSSSEQTAGQGVRFAWEVLCL